MTNSKQAGDLSHRCFAERYAAGKALRLVVSRESLGDFSAQERDPIAIVDETNVGRLRSLLPMRRERMSQTPVAFLRGAAAIMASDLASTRNPGVPVQACGDCQLTNFSAFASPEGNILFDINDFDETLPEVDFTVDVRRLAASFAVAALEAGASDRRARRIAKSAASAYRQRMTQMSRLSPLEVWQSRIHLKREGADLFDDGFADRLRSAASKARRDDDDDYPRLSHDKTTGGSRIEDRPPLIFHAQAGGDPAAHIDLAGVFAACLATLPPEAAAMLRRYRLRDSAFKAVGVGSVGTYCAIGLYMTEDGEPLFLQVKEARRSVLERLDGRDWIGLQGARVVSGQRVMQAAGDLFLGWTRDRASGRHFYIRQLKSRRLGSIAELLEEQALPQYAQLCGRTLARAHARSGNAAVVAGYMGKGEAFDDALASFAMLYAARNGKDFERFVEHRDAGP